MDALLCPPIHHIQFVFQYLSYIFLCTWLYQAGHRQHAWTQILVSLLILKAIYKRACFPNLCFSTYFFSLFFRPAVPPVLCRYVFLLHAFPFTCFGPPQLHLWPLTRLFNNQVYRSWGSAGHLDGRLHDQPTAVPAAHPTPRPAWPPSPSHAAAAASAPTGKFVH